jgi:pimeloyl-ACP methyl ester carboxylesterase
MPFIDRDDLRLAFDDTGPAASEPSRPPLVLCHSFLCSRDMWAGVVALLSRSHRVLNLDLRGHGDCGPAEDPFTIDDLVDDVVTVLDHLEVERAVWFGLSIGGMTAMRAAVTRPDRVAALIVADASAAAEPLAKRIKYRLLATAARALGMRRLIPAVRPILFGRTTLREQPELVREWSGRMASMHLPSMLTVLDMLLSRESALERLGEVRAPALILVGEEDRAQPPARSREIARAIPGAELVVIPEAGHLSALEQPEVVAATALDFLAEALPGDLAAGVAASVRASVTGSVTGDVPGDPTDGGGSGA